MPQTAKSCALGTTGYFIIASCVVFFSGLVMICLKAPELRTLKEDYGNSYHNNYMVGAQELHSGSLTDDPEGQIPVGNLDTMVDAQDEDVDTLVAANTSMVMSMSHDDSTTESYHQPVDPPSSSFINDPGSESFHAQLPPEDSFSSYPVDPMIGDGSMDNIAFNDSFINQSISGPRVASSDRETELDPPADAELHALAAKVAGGPDDELISSATKVASTQNELNMTENSDDLIDKCVTELQESFK